MAKVKTVKSGDEVKAESKSKSKPTGIEPGHFDVTYSVRGRSGRVSVEIESNDDYPDDADDFDGIKMVYANLETAITAVEGILLDICTTPAE